MKMFKSGLFYLCSLTFVIPLLFLSHIEQISTLEPYWTITEMSTDVLPTKLGMNLDPEKYRGFKTLWKSYTPSIPSQIKIIDNGLWNVNATTAFQKPIYTIHKDLKPPFFMQDEEYEYSELRKRPEKSVSYLRQGGLTWYQPSVWQTPGAHKTLLWLWTTTMRPGHDPRLYGNRLWELTKRFGDKFYDNTPTVVYLDLYYFIHYHRTAVGGTTDHGDPLPTLLPVYGSTRVWRFWSYNYYRRSIDTYLALETEPTTTKFRRITTTLESGHLASCYVCGLNLTGIPRMPSCYYVFDDPERLKYTGHKQSLKKHCYVGPEKLYNTGKRWYGPLHRRGCFKRFTDVGVEFNERGCRTMVPVMGYSFASKRFAKLEMVLHDVDEGCVFSPFASLTPFSRSISLYVRYHVCVCQGKYCNVAPPTYASLTSIFITVYYLIYYTVKYSL